MLPFPVHVSRTDRLRFLRAYGAARSEWQELANAVEQVASQKRGWHGLGWKLERMFGRLKDYRRIATRFDRNVRNYMAAVCIAVTVIWWLA